MFANFLVWATLALSATALATPHSLRSPRSHHAVARRQTEPEVIAARAPPYQLRKRCAPRPLPSSSSSVTPTTSAAANAGTDPDQDSQPTTTYQPPAYTPPTQSNPSGGSSSYSGVVGSLYSGSESGDGTYYDTGLGACGWTNTDSDMIAAIAFGTFDTYPGYNGANPNNNPICGKTVTATYGANTATVTIVDRCAGCMKDSSLDFSPAAFQLLSPLGAGRIQIEWSWDE